MVLATVVKIVIGVIIIAAVIVGAYLLLSPILNRSISTGPPYVMNTDGKEIRLINLDRLIKGQPAYLGIASATSTQFTFHTLGDETNSIWTWVSNDNKCASLNVYSTRTVDNSYYCAAKYYDPLKANAARYNCNECGSFERRNAGAASICTACATGSLQVISTTSMSLLINVNNIRNKMSLRLLRERGESETVLSTTDDMKTWMWASKADVDPEVFANLPQYRNLPAVRFSYDPSNAVSFLSDTIVNVQDYPGALLNIPDKINRSVYLIEYLKRKT